MMKKFTTRLETIEAVRFHRGMQTLPPYTTKGTYEEGEIGYWFEVAGERNGQFLQDGDWVVHFDDGHWEIISEKNFLIRFQPLKDEV